MNVDHSDEIYELFVTEVYTNLSGMTLRPMSYTEITTDAEEIRFDGIKSRTMFMERVTRWMVKHGYKPKKWNFLALVVSSWKV